MIGQEDPSRFTSWISGCQKRAFTLWYSSGVGPARCRRFAQAPLGPRHIRQKGHKGDRRTNHWGHQEHENVAAAPLRNVSGGGGGGAPRVRKRPSLSAAH